MFLGHFAAGLLASRSEPRLPLGTAFLAAQLLAGAERVEIAPGDTAVTPLRFVHYPWCPQLFDGSSLGLAAGFVYRRLGRTNGASFLYCGGGATAPPPAS